MHEVLFICTGNFYRSRLAEALFNHAAERRGLEWRAFSRGLATYLVDGAGPISTHTRFALLARNIPLHYTAARPAALAVADLQRAAHVIALKEAEHRAMMHAQFPEWENRIAYWHIHDLDAAAPDTAVPEIERLTLHLLEKVAAEAAKPQAPEHRA